MNRTRTLALLLAALALTVGLVACGGGSDSTGAEANGTQTSSQETTATTGGEKSAIPTIVIRDGEPVGGIEELGYSAGEEVRFKVESDVAEEIHVHGYDLMKDVPAGGSVSFDFPAELEGIFEAEMEGQGVQILQLTVNP
jgi:hypothetical protein